MYTVMEGLLNQFSYSKMKVSFQKKVLSLNLFKNEQVWRLSLYVNYSSIYCIYLTMKEA